MTLTAAGSPYTGSTTIESGATVTVEPGTEFTITLMTVKGTLKAEGTHEKPILFTSKGEKPGDWNGIRIEPGSGASVLDHVEVEYAGYQAVGATVGAVEINASSPTIEHSVFQDNKGWGVRMSHGGAPEIAENSFFDNGAAAISYTSTTGETGDIDIHDNLVEGGAYGIFAAVFQEAKVTATRLSGNTVVETEDDGLKYTGSSIPSDVTGNTLIGNANNYIVLSGTVAESSTWNDGGSPVKFETEVEVASGVTLKITKGVRLVNPRMVVKGTLLAEGSAEEPIEFTGRKEEKAGEWRNVKFEPGSGASVLDHVEVKYGGDASANIGVIEVNASSPTIVNTTVSYNDGWGVRMSHGGAPEIADNVFVENEDAAISYTSTTGESGDIDIHDNTVLGGGYGISVSVFKEAKVTATTLSGNTVIGTGNNGLKYTGSSIPGNITENTLIGNANNYIVIDGTVAKSSTWNDGGSQVKVEGEVTVPAGVTLKITSGVYMVNPKFSVKGTLQAEGTAEDPVVFTGPKRESPGEWGNVKFTSSSTGSVLDHVEVAYGGTTSGTGMIEAQKASPQITNSTIRRSQFYGIKVTESGSPKIERNRFRGNANGLSYSGTGKLFATNNDWGCASGPSPSGCGDSVSSNVEWKPALPPQELGGHCRGGESQCGEGADPVSLATGALSYSHRDLLLTNKGGIPLEFVRSYASGSESDTGLGPGWAQTGLASATELESGDVLVLRQDGRQDLFAKTESGYKAPTGVTDTLARVEGTFRLTTLQNAAYAFDSSGRIAQVTDDHGLKTTYAYNANGRLATITDPSSQTLTFTYNASNHITLVKDSTGREVKFAYSAAGDLESVTDALGGVTKYAYDASHRMTSITDPRGNVILKNTYDGQGRITEQKDGLENLWKLAYKEGETTVTEPEGGKLVYGFDGHDRVVSETDQLGHETTTAYDAAGNVKEILQPGGAKWTFGHDAAGNLTSIKDPEGGERKYEYDAQNRLTDFTDARGNAWAYEWSKASDLTKIVDPEEAETALTYNEAGQPLSVTDANEHKSEFTYDSRGNMLTRTDPLGHKTSFEFNSRNYLTSLTKPGLKAEGFERNALGDVLARTTPEGNKTKYAYDANGMPTQITDPAENVWKIAYDAMERPTTYTDPLEGQAKVAYDGNLQPLKVTDRRGKETTYEYDAANQLTDVHRPEGGDWAFGYDGRGNRTSVVDPRESETTYEYDLLDRMTEADEPLGATSEYGYDANGNLMSVVDPRGNETTYEYDQLGRLAEIAQPLEKTTAYAYDAVGNPLTRTTAAGTLEYGYDADDRLTKVSSGESTPRSFGYDAADRLTGATDAESHKIEIGYDNDSRVASIKDGRGQSLTRTYNSRGLLTKQVDGRGTLEYGYDKLGRLTSLTDPQGKALGFAYDPEGNLTEAKRPNGVTTTNVYDDAGRLAETTSEDEASTVLEALEYDYDPAGNVTGRFDARLEAETTFAYDDLNRLTEFDPPGEGATVYGYDEAGNRTEAGPTTYEYNALNQLTESSDGTTYTYDGAGRMTGMENGEEETTYEWDLFDHLAKVEGPTGTASYAFDALERLSERKSGESTQVVHYGDLTDLPTYDANGEGKTTTSYVQGPRSLLEQRSGETTSFPLRDAHGDITAITNSTAEVVSRQSYDPWGDQLSGPSLEMGYLGAQQRRADLATGLIQMGARSYDPALGRFGTEDPVLGHLGISATFNRYPYAGNNPLLYFDLDGRDFLGDVGGVIGETWNATGDRVWDEVAGARSFIGVAGDGNGGWLSETPGFVSDRSMDLVKEINLSTEELIAVGATSLGTYAMCRAVVGATAVGTPAAGVGAFSLCVLLEVTGAAETANDIVDDNNGLWTDEFFE